MRGAARLEGNDFRAQPGEVRRALTVESYALPGRALLWPAPSKARENLPPHQSPRARMRQQRDCDVEQHRGRLAQRPLREYNREPHIIQREARLHAGRWMADVDHF